jgi:hypothetical protein
VCLSKYLSLPHSLTPFSAPFFLLSQKVETMGRRGEGDSLTTSLKAGIEEGTQQFSLSLSFCILIIISLAQSLALVVILAGREGGGGV